MLKLEVRSAIKKDTLGLHSDLTRCYERVPLHVMQAVAVAYGIPSTVVALIVSMYRAPNFLTVDCLTTSAHPDRVNGMLAGCRVAVQLMALLGDTLMRAWHRHVPTLDARGFVDDIVFHSGGHATVGARNVRAPMVPAILLNAEAATG
eukprot:731510-Amphidinium_carterae.3